MRDKRTLRKPGDRIVLGETVYQIEGTEGCGGCSVVYRAVYEDRLNTGQYHEVLIKELYPATTDGSIYRDQSGWIRFTEAGEALMRQSRQSFYRGNAANLTLLREMPDRISGNLNSYEAYGTYYTVLFLHGGRGLQTVLEEETLTLRQMTQMMLQILEALACFHEAGALHLDISPDNILMMPTYAMLIDYNTVWTADSDPEDFLFSEKAGYVSPEVRLRQFPNIGRHSDLYSVAAIFFRMVTGRRMESSDQEGRGLKKSLRRDLPAFRDVPATAAQMAVQILGKGLHILPRKRYQDAGEMKRDLEELLLRIDRKGVTEASLWEESGRQWRRQCGQKGASGNMKSLREAYLPREIRTEEGKVLSEEQIRLRLAEGERLLLKGAGGLGKTEFLKVLWKAGTTAFRRDAPIVFYIPLSGYQESGTEPYYIRKYLLRRLCLTEKEETLEICMQELDRLLDGAAEHRWIFLLDGFNEAGTKTQLLLKEIEGLAEKPQVGILVTDRTDQVKQYALMRFRSIELQPLSEAAVRICLAQRGWEYPQNAQLAQALGNPMLLSLYIETKNMAGECGTAPEEESEQEIIRQYLDTLCVTELQRNSGDKAGQLRQKYLLQHLLPEIACAMKQKNRTLFTVEELSECLRKDYQMLRSREFSAAFPEYLGKSRLMFADIADEREWFDYCITEQLSERIGLLEETEEYGYRFVHDIFIDSLAGIGEENREKVRKVRRKARIKRGALAGVFVLLAAGIVFLAYTFMRADQLSAEEEELLTSAATRLEINLGILNLQLDSQNTILEEMGETDVLEGEELALNNLLELVELQISSLDTVYGNYSDGSNYVTEIEAMRRDIPVSMLSELYTSPEDMQQFFEENLILLLERFCYEDSVYNTPEKREPMLEACESYLDAYTDVYYLKYDRYLSVMEELGAEEVAEELAEAMQAVTSFNDCIILYSLGGLSEEDYEKKLSAAEEKLLDAELLLAQQNLYY